MMLEDEATWIDSGGWIECRSCVCELRTTLNKALVVMDKDAGPDKEGEEQKRLSRR